MPHGGTTSHVNADRGTEIYKAALCTAPREGGVGSGVAFGRQPTRALLHEAVASY